MSSPEDVSKTVSLMGPPANARAWSTAIVSGLGGFIVIYLLALLTADFHTLLLIAPFGASCVLVFALPQSPLAQPRNVIGGHLVSTTVGLVTFTLLGSQPLSFGIAVGVAIAAMELTGTLHPPAGADPIVVLLAKASWTFLLSPVLTGAIAIVALGFVYHRAISRRRYPTKMF
jgi:CBS-domain-containing membrane protein